VKRASLQERVAALIARLSDGGRDDAARDALLRELSSWQREAMPAYGRMLDALGANSGDPLTWPAVPSDVFRFARVAAHPAHEDVRVFRTSGTTGASRGSHHLRDLALYDSAARAAARYALFPDVERMKLVSLAPAASELPDSSLSYMLERFGAWFGEGASVQLLRGGELDRELLLRTLETAEQRAEPIALLGASFAFVHADEALGERRFRLAPGSRIMQTGGFKGRTRELEPAQMLGMLVARFGVDQRFVVQEYGMTELSSQLYEPTLREAALGQPLRARRLWVPGWLRATPIDPETMAPVADGDEGLLRIDDLANIDSPCAIQTSDRARREGDAIVLLGRAAGATLRGCSIAVDAALGG
jgi:hypothetical protein